MDFVEKVYKHLNILRNKKFFQMSAGEDFVEYRLIAGIFVKKDENFNYNTTVVKSAQAGVYVKLKKQGIKIRWNDVIVDIKKIERYLK